VVFHNVSVQAFTVRATQPVGCVRALGERPRWPSKGGSLREGGAKPPGMLSQIHMLSHSHALTFTCSHIHMLSHSHALTFTCSYKELHISPVEISRSIGVERLELVPEQSESFVIHLAHRP